MLILREFRRLGKQADYTALKRRMVDVLSKDGWDRLAALILKEDNAFINEYVETDNTGMAFEIELEELANSQEPPDAKTEKIK